MGLEKVMEELHIEIIVFDNEYPLGHHFILAPPPASGAERRAILGAQPLTRASHASLRLARFRRKSGRIGIFGLRKLNIRLTA
jgi:hypothetical protein